MHAPLKCKNQNGFTLIEIAVVIAIVGLIAGSTFSFLTAQRTQEQYEITVERQKKIAIALSEFMQRNGRLPCIGVNTGAVIGNEEATCNQNVAGIVPYRALGLTEEDVTDGYGNPFSYTVRSSYRSVLGNNNIHENCRTTVWGGSVNLNPNKAKICCQQRSTVGIRVLDQNNNLVTPVYATNPPSAGAYANITTAGGASPVPYTGTLASFAYVLVSHGQNGWQSFTFGNNTTRKPAPWGTVTAQELQNGAGWNDDGVGNAIFYNWPLNTTSANYIDDIILWRTQEQIMRETGDTSCARP